MLELQQSAFRALADTTRREILLELANEDLTISQVCDRFPITRTAVKKHLTILEEGNLISVHKIGRERVNRLEPAAMKPVVDWLGYFSQFWDEKLSDLATAIENDE